MGESGWCGVVGNDGMVQCCSVVVLGESARARETERWRSCGFGSLVCYRLYLLIDPNDRFRL